MVREFRIGPHAVNDPQTWPPGSLMKYDTSVRDADDRRLHRNDFGLVVANDGECVRVLWKGLRFSHYQINLLNPDVIFPIL